MTETAQLNSAAISDRGLSEKRPQNEDSYLDLPQYGLFAVADGVGGAQAGDVASQMAVEILGEAFAHRTNSDAEELMKIAIERANSAIFQMASDLPQLSTMATTIVAIHVAGDVATIGHVGDSRLYRFDPSGNVFRETSDHSVVEEEVRAGRMSPEEAENHPSKNVISRALGAEGTVEVELKTIMAEPGTTFLLCSDGITRHVHDWELKEIFSNGASLTDVCQRLKDLCYERGAEDNLTAVVVRAGEATHGDAGVSEFKPDKEEVTVASARLPFDDTISDDATIVPLGTESNGTDSDTDSATDTHLDDKVPIVVKSAAAAPPHDPAPATLGAFPPPKATGTSPIASTRQSEVVDRPKLANQALLAVGFLLLGGLLGAAAFYLFVPAPPAPIAPAVQPPAITEMKSNNTALTAFEEGRRQVDSDPAKYIASKAAAPQGAEDFYLLGRAYLLTGKFWEAKQNFNQAKAKLADTADDNAKTLSAEIALALAIIESPSATDSFSRNYVNQHSADNANGAPAGAMNR